MKSLKDYIFEEKKPPIERGNIKFTIWKSPEEKVTYLNNNTDYQKIEYQYKNTKLGIEIDFLLGFQQNTWKLWIGKIGSCSYDDDPYCSFNTDKFSEAIIMALDKVEEFLDKVKEEPENYVQYYLNI